MGLRSKPRMFLQPRLRSKWGVGCSGQCQEASTARTETETQAGCKLPLRHRSQLGGHSCIQGRAWARLRLPLLVVECGIDLCFLPAVATEDNPTLANGRVSTWLLLPLPRAFHLVPEDYPTPPTMVGACFHHSGYWAKGHPVRHCTCRTEHIACGLGDGPTQFTTLEPEHSY